MGGGGGCGGDQGFRKIKKNVAKTFFDAVVNAIYLGIEKITLTRI